MLKRPCHYFNTTGKCRFGKHCKFEHGIEILQERSASQPNENEAVNQVKEDQLKEKSEIFKFDFNTNSVSTSQDASLNSKSEEILVGKEGSNICRSYAKSRFCRYGKRCRYQHILPGKQEGSKNVSEIKESDVASKYQDGTEKDKVQNEEILQNQESVNKDNAVKSLPSQKVCKFFKRGFCHFGKRCHFYHPSGTAVSKPEDVGSESQTSDINAQPPAADKTDDNKEWTQVSRAPKIINVFKRSEVDSTKLKELRDTEIKQLKRRFPADKLQILNETDENATFVFSFIPSDPDWPFDVKSFDIQVSFDENYPLKLFSVDVPLDQDLPATVQRYTKVSLQEWVSKKEEECVKKDVLELLFRPFLRWMDRSMENIVTEGLKQLRRELTAKAAGLQFIPANELKREQSPEASGDTDFTEDSSDLVAGKDTRSPVAYRKFDHNEDEVYTGPENDDSGAGVNNLGSDDSNNDDSDDDDDDDGSGDDGNTEDADNKVHQRPKIDPDTERRGTEVSFRNMQIWYCTTIMMEKLRLTVQCERCKNTTDFNTPPNRVNSVACSKCNNTQLAVFRPVLAHAYSSTFGYLDLDGCVAFDVILQDCHFSMGCVQCSRDILVKSFIAGRVMEIRCRGCHSMMKFSADSVKLTTLTADGVDSAKFSGKIYTVKVRKNQRVLKDPAIQEGKPLPDNGACKHYKKSFRWLRFPCCGKTYPCDLCHDDKEDHEMKFANRMICGFCCREQAFAADRPCAGCSSALTKVRTAHWEGGRGCRDKISMSRFDGKKYTNLNKTVSNKAKNQQEKKQGKKNTKLRHT